MKSANIQRKHIPAWAIVKAFKIYNESYRIVASDPKYFVLDNPNYRDKNNKLTIEYYNKQATVLAPIEILCSWFPFAPEKVLWSAIQHAADKDYLDYGCSLRYAWTTEKGLDLLEKNSDKSEQYISSGFR